jgi:hypothetical protein
MLDGYHSMDRNAVRGRPRPTYLDQFDQVLLVPGQGYPKSAGVYDDFNESRKIESSIRIVVSSNGRDVNVCVCRCHSIV